MCIHHVSPAQTAVNPKPKGKLRRILRSCCCCVCAGRSHSCLLQQHEWWRVHIQWRVHATESWRGGVGCCTVAIAAAREQSGSNTRGRAGGEASHDLARLSPSPPPFAPAFSPESCRGASKGISSAACTQRSRRSASRLRRWWRRWQWRWWRRCLGGSRWGRWLRRCWRWHWCFVCCSCGVVRAVSWQFRRQSATRAWQLRGFTSQEQSRKFSGIRHPRGTTGADGPWQNKNQKRRHG